MDFVTNLKNAWEDTFSRSRPPQNLKELSQHLLDAARKQGGHKNLAKFCRIWADETGQAMDGCASDLRGMHGKLQEMWLEQREIYEDLIDSLETAGDLVEAGAWTDVLRHQQDFEGLLAELAASIQEMRIWQETSSLRCLACGWAPTTALPQLCPHCKVTTLHPVRNVRDGNGVVLPLGPRQQEVYDLLRDILDGKEDLFALEESLGVLEDHYLDCLREIREDGQQPDLLLVVEHICSGLTLLAKTFQDADGQHLEDGWNAFFTGEQALQEMIRDLQAEEELVEMHRETSQEKPDLIFLSSKE